MRKFLAPLALSFVTLLSACQFAAKPLEPPQNDQTKNPMVEEDTETPQDDPIVSTSTGTGAVPLVPERLMSTGILEIGDATAPLVLLLWTNHFCQYCQEFDAEILPRLQRDFIDTGKLRLQIVILPLKKYPQSHFTSSALHCAARQGKGFVLHESLMKNPAQDLSVLQKDTSLSLDQEKFRTCMEGDTSVSFIIEQQESLAHSLDTTLVPTLFLNGEKHVGSPTYSDLQGMIEKALKDLE